MSNIVVGVNSFLNRKGVWAAVILSIVTVAVAIAVRNSTPITSGVGQLRAEAEPQKYVEAPARSTQKEKPLQLSGSVHADQTIATWKGSEIDGGLKVDASGDLIIDLAVRDYFDYMMSAVGDIEPEQVLAMIEQHAAQTLPPAAVDQVMALLDDYLAFKQSALALMRAPLVNPAKQTPAYYLETLGQTFEQLKLLRRSHLSPVAVEEFFGLEEAYGEFTLAQIRIQSLPDLTAQQKAQRIEALRWQLPPELASSLVSREDHKQAQQKTASVLSSTLTEDEKRAQLSDVHSPDMVERILQRERQGLQWQARFDRYQSQKQSLIKGAAGAEQLHALMLEHFPTAKEQTLAKTYEAKLARQ